MASEWVQTKERLQTKSPNRSTCLEQTSARPSLSLDPVARQGRYRLLRGRLPFPMMPLACPALSLAPHQLPPWGPTCWALHLHSQNRIRLHPGRSCLVLDAFPNAVSSTKPLVQSAVSGPLPVFLHLPWVPSTGLLWSLRSPVSPAQSSL